jgi:hypothetical protein
MIFAMLLAVLSASFTFSQTEIRFKRGRTSASISSPLDGGLIKRFVLRAREGQRLSGIVASARECVKFADGQTLIAFETITGLNRISIRNTCRTRVNFTLTVSIVDPER